MSDFYRRFLNLYFKTISNKRVSYKSLIRRRMPNALKAIFYYEAIIDWLTRRLSNHRIYAALIYRDNLFINDIEKFAGTYELLNDEFSRSQYIQYVCYKAINSSRIRLDTGKMDIERDVKKVLNCEIKNDLIKGFSNIGNLNLYDLSKIGYEAQLINEPIGTLIDFVYEQYAYKDIFRVEKDDVVIDCGGAIGDTAVYFSAKGASEVHVFEFIPSNIGLIHKQMELNSHFKTKVKIVEYAVWSSTDVELSYLDKGNSSRVDAVGVYPNSVKTMSIDDMCIRNNVVKVDLIKMDIEGAELPALMGAQDTISKFKPKLAICVYHKSNDLLEIPEYIKSLNPDYDFYFNYYTDVGWEAVLYAVNRPAL